MLPRLHARGIWKTYGYAGVGTYLGIYFSSLGILTIAARYGYLKSPKIEKYLNNPPVRKYLPAPIERYLTEEGKKTNTLTSQFMVAWVACKLIEPLRLGATIALMPYVRRRFF